MTALRTSKGLNLIKADGLIAGTSTQILSAANQFLEKTWLTKTGDDLTLTLAGKLYADYIAAQLFL